MRIVAPLQGAGYFGVSNQGFALGWNIAPLAGRWLPAHGEPDAPCAPWGESTIPKRRSQEVAASRSTGGRSA